MSEPEQTPEINPVFTAPKQLEIKPKRRVSIRKHIRPDAMFRNSIPEGSSFIPKSGFGTTGKSKIVTGGKRKTQRRNKNNKKTRKHKQKSKSKGKAKKSRKTKA